MCGSCASASPTRISSTSAIPAASPTAAAALRLFCSMHGRTSHSCSRRMSSASWPPAARCPAPTPPPRRRCCPCPTWASWMRLRGRPLFPPATAASASSAPRPPSAPAAMRPCCANWCRAWRSPPAPARCSCRWWKPGMLLQKHTGTGSQAAHQKLQDP